MTYEGGHVLCPIELRADLLVTFVSPANPNYTLVTSTSQWCLDVRELISTVTGEDSSRLQSLVGQEDFSFILFLGKTFIPSPLGESYSGWDTSLFN